MDFFKNHPQWPFISEIIKKLNGSGYTAWLAGGCVRDFLLKIKPVDFDIVTNATPDAVLKLFPEGLDVGKQFGVIVIPRDKFQIEIATFRSDGSYSDGRHPDNVVFSTPEQDAERRDFTINALFYDLGTIKIHDYVGGQQDLEKRIIRAVGEPEKRFQEDKLRMLRAIRFSAQLDFEIEINTLNAIKKMSSQIAVVSVERIQHELNRLLESKNPGKGLELLRESRLLGEIFKIPLEAHWGQTLRLIQNPGPLSLKWALLLYYPSQKFSDRTEEISTFLKRYRFSNAFEAEVLSLFKFHEKIDAIQKMRVGESLGFIHTPFANLGLEFHRFICLIENKNLENYEFAKKLKTKYPRLPQPLLSGEHLIRLGLQPGPKFKEILQSVYYSQIENNITDLAKLLELAKKFKN